MNNYQGILDAITSMQQNAQAALPVAPNNGNPQGANNMPTQPAAKAAPTPAMPAVQPEYFYSWMAPSPHMQSITERILAMQKPAVVPQRAAPMPQPAVTNFMPQVPPATRMPVLPELGPVRSAEGTWTRVR